MDWKSKNLECLLQGQNFHEFKHQQCEDATNNEKMMMMKMMTIVG